MELPLQQINLVNEYGLAVAVERDDEAEADGRLGGGDDDDEDREDLTRHGVHVDRIACAWLVRRFIDPAARFKFVPPRGYVPEEGELRFDMFQAEFTHQGDSCSFEVLLARTGLRDPGLQVIAEIVHDIDLKDAKFGREETAGIKSLIAGVAKIPARYIPFLFGEAFGKWLDEALAEDG